MKKNKHQHPPVKWEKGQTHPCPTGKCSHRHLKGTGPCVETGCGCHGSYYKRKGS